MCEMQMICQHLFSILHLLVVADNWLQCESDHSSLSSAKANNVRRSCTSTSPYSFMLLCLIKHISA
jgi:hypothetical protein